MNAVLAKFSGPRTASRGLRLSEDGVADAAAKAHAAWVANQSYFASELHLLHWLRRTARWHTITQFRRDSRPELVRAEEVVGRRRGPGEPRKGAWTEEDCRTVWECVQQLPPVKRFLVEGRYYGRMTDRQLACAVFDTQSPTTAQCLRVWHRRKKAEAMLRELLERRGVGPAGFGVPDTVAARER